MSAFFLCISYICSEFYTNCSTSFCLFSRQLFNLTSKIRLTSQKVSCPLFSKSQTINRPQWSTKASISPEQTLNFLLTTAGMIYLLVGLQSNRFYDIFIFERLYQDQIWNVITQFRYFRDNMYCFVCQLINKSKHTFILITFDLYMRQQSNHCWTFLRYHHPRDIFVV